MKTLGAYHKKVSYESVPDIHKYLQSDIEAFEELLKVLTRKSWYITHIFNTLSLSPIEIVLDDDNEPLMMTERV